MWGAPYLLAETISLPSTGYTHGRRRPLHLILDRLPAHRTNVVTQYVVGFNGTLTLHYLLGYAHGHELVWRYAKQTGTARRALQKGEKLAVCLARQLAAMGRRPASGAITFRYTTGA